jgi:hypothetical protein
METYQVNPDQLNYIIALVLCSIGFLCAGLRLGYRNELKLRIVIVRLEHHLARKEEREPRDIDDLIDGKV